MHVDLRRSSGRRWTAVVGAACLLLAAAPALAARADPDASPGAPPGVCEAGAPAEPPLPGAALSATRVQSGFSFLEGPVWIADPGHLLVSDLGTATGAEQVQPSTIRRLAPPAPAETFVAACGSNGLALSPDGQQIIAATHDNRTVSAFRLSDGSRTVVAADYQGRAFNSPNDVTVRADGVVYFTDPNFQRGRRPDAMDGRTGVFRVANGRSPSAARTG
jgi:gluconolactonase